MVEQLKEAYNLYNQGLQDEILISAMNEIIKYINNDRDNFPILSKFYN